MGEYKGNLEATLNWLLKESKEIQNPPLFKSKGSKTSNIAQDFVK